MSEPAPLPWPAARVRAFDAATPLDPVCIPLVQALGATLAVPLVARADLPAWDTAAMDGYAVRGLGPWRLVGRSIAGAPLPLTLLREGEAVEVSTGAGVPVGTEAVLPYERAQLSAGGVRGSATLGRHVRRAGDECRLGAELLPAGTRLGPAGLGLAASVGHDSLRVRRRPRVSALLTGDEVLRCGMPEDGRIRDAIGPMLPGLVAGLGADLVDLVYLPDDPRRLREGLERAGASADVVVTSGAASVGPADHLRGVLAGLGAGLLVAGVACRPGHPMLLGRWPDGGCVVGLPGNPFAALAAALTLLGPVIRACAGADPERLPRAVLAEPMSAHPTDTRLVAVRRCHDHFRPVGHDRPGLLWGAALADALAVVPPGGCHREVELLLVPP